MSFDFALIVFIILCTGAAMTGAFFTPGAWYAGLNKPSWNPPNWAFPIAWTVLYAMIAVAGWLLWRAGGNAVTLPLVFWGVQLVLNALWSPIFFGMKKMGLALADLSLMWLAIAATIVTAWPVARDAALLLLPYLAWVSFAGVLNFTMLRLNPGV